jgi:hypothetical protein
MFGQVFYSGVCVVCVSLITVAAVNVCIRYTRDQQDMYGQAFYSRLCIPDDPLFRDVHNPLYIHTEYTHGVCAHGVYTRSIRTEYTHGV